MSGDRGRIRRLDLGVPVYVKAPVAAGTTPARTPSPRVPRVALAVGAVLAGGALVRVGITPHGMLAGGLLAVLTALAAIDLRSRVLPNRIVGPTLIAVLAWQLVFFGDRWAEWIGAGLGAGLMLLLPSLVRPGAIGMGDVKLAVLLGLALGGDVVPALTIGCLAAVPVAVVLLLRNRAGGATIAYGPFLALGTAVVLLG
jgi:leader peptidase (prepilin peptidase) / N-methyltransferase